MFFSAHLYCHVASSGMQELGALSSVLNAAWEADNGVFALELAVAASAVDALSLSNWLPALSAENSTSMVTAISSFLTRKLEAQTGHRPCLPIDRTALEQLAAVRTLTDLLSTR